MPPELQLIEVTAPAIVAKIGELRVRAWRTEVEIDTSITNWIDKWDATARHWAFMHGDEPVAAARLSVHQSMSSVPDAEYYHGVFEFPPSSPIASLNRLVVAPEYRGHHLSIELDRIRLEASREMGCKCAIGATSSGERRIRQLESLGFTLVGEGMPNVESKVLRGCGVKVLICQL